MSYMKRWFEAHVHEISDEELLEWGYTEEDIQLFRECYPAPKREAAT